jgi:ribosomal protein S3AE
MAPKDMLKKKKKKWFTIVSTSQFNNAEIGETTTEEPSRFIGNIVSVNLMNLTQDMKSQNTKVKFKIREVKDDKLLTDFVGYELIPSSLKRMVHKDKEKIEDSFVLTTKDNVKVRIKPFLVTRSSTHKSVLTALRKKAKELLTDNLKKKTYSLFLEEIVRFRIQSMLRKELNKVFPITQFQIKTLKRLD